MGARGFALGYRRRERALTDSRAVRDIIQSLAGTAVSIWMSSGRLVSGAAVVLQWDEPASSAVLYWLGDCRRCRVSCGCVRSRQSCCATAAPRSQKLVASEVDYSVLVHCCAPDALVPLVYVRWKGSIWLSTIPG